MSSRKAAAVSMSPELFDRANVRAEELHHSTFSAYVVQLIAADLAGTKPQPVHTTPASTKEPLTPAQLIQCADSLNRHARDCTSLIADFEESYGKHTTETLANLINGYRDDRRHIEATLAAVMVLING